MRGPNPTFSGFHQRIIHVGSLIHYGRGSTQISQNRASSEPALCQSRPNANRNSKQTISDNNNNKKKIRSQKRKWDPTSFDINPEIKRLFPSPLSSLRTFERRNNAYKFFHIHLLLCAAVYTRERERELVLVCVCVKTKVFTTARRSADYSSLFYFPSHDVTVSSTRGKTHIFLLPHIPPSMRLDMTNDAAEVPNSLSLSGFFVWSPALGSNQQQKRTEKK